MQAHDAARLLACDLPSRPSAGGVPSHAVIQGRSMLLSPELELPRHFDAVNHQLFAMYSNSTDVEPTFPSASPERSLIRTQFEQFVESSMSVADDVATIWNATRFLERAACFLTFSLTIKPHQKQGKDQSRTSGRIIGALMWSYTTIYQLNKDQARVYYTALRKASHAILRDVPQNSSYQFILLSTISPLEIYKIFTTVITKRCQTLSSCKCSLQSF
jgi:hypothetical protein